VGNRRETEKNGGEGVDSIKTVGRLKVLHCVDIPNNDEKY